MAYRIGNNAQETTSNKPASSATAFNLSGATTGRRGIVAAIGDGNSATFIAQKVDANNNPSGAWQIFIGTVTDAATDTVSQTTLVASSSGSFIDWSATGENSSPLITVVMEESRVPRRTQSIAFAGESSYDIQLRAACEYHVLINGLDFSNDNVGLHMRVSTDGSTFDSGAGNYSYDSSYATTSTAAASGSSSATEMQIWSGAFFGNADAKEEFGGQFWILGANDSGVYTRVTGSGRTAIYSTGNEYNIMFAGSRLAAQADVALRIYPSAGTFAGGRLTVWEYPVA